MPKPIPSVVPEGWQESLNWSCKCRYYVPQSAAMLPPPITWEPCPEANDGLVCQSMVMNWAGKESKIAANPSMDRNPDGSAVLQLARYVNKAYSIHMVADADGPVRTAMYFVWGGKAWTELECRTYDEGVNEGKFIILFRGNDIEEWEDYQGAIGSDLDNLHPPPLMKYKSPVGAYTQGMAGGATGFLVLDNNLALHLHPWDTSEKIFITSAAVDPEGLKAGYLRIRDGAAFWGTSTLYRTGINVWDPIGGARPFIRWVGDWTRGAGNFGTDGIDMVWCQGEGKAPNETKFPIRSIMTAPFTTDPAKLQPRRLRALPTNRISGAPAQVGCGYAALEGPANDLIVTRLSDGWSWFVPNTVERRLSTALGLTCTELFATGEINGRYTIARVRLDSLGTGLPPD
ncbi:MAG: hypothetical protein IPM54_08305 [Polyangiaceae bacterium]|nr:hypothetical protein [Polyangiaceae bacterium]